MGLRDFTILSFGSLFVMVDPIAILPAFMAMTEKNSISERIRMAKIACAVAFLVLVFFALGGQLILRVVGISIPAFEIAGGILLLMIALDMLQARRTAVKETPEEEVEGAGKDDIAITPLAVPMLAGPGAITTVILLVSQIRQPVQYLILIFNVALVSGLSFLTFKIAASNFPLISGITMKIVTRLMGLLLAAIAVQFMLNGLHAAKLTV